MNPEDLQNEFVTHIRARWAQGAVDYGDRSFRAPLPNLCDEMLEEAVDIAAWMLFAYDRIRNFQTNAGNLDALLQFVAVCRKELHTGHATTHVAIHRMRRALEALDAGETP